eukprot:9822317-Lingulodinium_polyedra.AAC.1
MHAACVEAFDVHTEKDEDCINGACLTEDCEQERVQSEESETQQYVNDELVPVQPSTLEGKCHLFYCGRRLGVAAIPGSDG